MQGIHLVYSAMILTRRLVRESSMRAFPSNFASPQQKTNKRKIRGEGG